MFWSGHFDNEMSLVWDILPNIGWMDMQYYQFGGNTERGQQSIKNVYSTYQRVNK